MVSNMGLGLSGVIDPYLNWKSASKGRQRATRQRRISFVGVKINKSTAKSSKEREEPVDKDPKRVGDTLVSETEKLGVSILGQRFSDSTLEFVPIKKRRVCLVPPLSPLPQLASHLDGLGNQTKLGRETFIDDGSTNMKEINENLSDIPDFSGIELLAAAACDNLPADDIMDVEDSASKGHQSEGISKGISKSAQPHFLSEVKEEQLLSSCGDLDIRNDTIGSLDNVQSTVSSVESSSRSHKFHWDLNIVPDLWDCDKATSASGIDEDGVLDEKSVNTEPCHGHAGVGGAKLAGELIDGSVHFSGVSKDGETRFLHGPERGSSLVNALEKEKADAYHVCSGSMVENETSSSNMILCENACIDHTTHASESYPGLDQRTAVFVIEESTVSVVDLDVKTQGESNGSLRTDSAEGTVDQNSTFSHLVEEASDVLLERISARRILAHTDGISGEVAHIDALDNNTIDVIDHSKLDSNSCLSDSHPFTFQGSSNHDELSSGNTSAGTIPGLADAPPLDATLSSHETCKSYADSYVNSPSAVASLNHSDHGHNFYASKTDTDEPTGLERVEFLTDDDSQYEDGEFRGSVIISWGNDEAKDGETESVGCRLDDRGVDVAETTSLHFDNKECNNVRLSEVSKVHRDGTQAGKDTQDAVSQSFQKDPLIRDISDARCGKRIAGNLTTNGSRGHLRILDRIKKVERNAKGAFESADGSDKVVVDNKFSKESDGSWESIQLASSRLKSSGWAPWPEGCRISGDVVMDSGVDHPVNKNQNVGLKSREDLPLRIQRPKASDKSHRKDKYHVNTCRTDDGDEPNFKFGGDIDKSRSFRGDRDRVDHWVDSRNHWNQNFRDYELANFTRRGSKNAVAAVTAKLESNGFVIAPDGTIIKAGGAGPTGRVLTRPVHAPSERTSHPVRRRRSPIERDEEFGMPRRIGNLREMTPDRHINIGQGRTQRYDPGVLTARHKERYLASVPYDRPFPRKDRSFSPRRRPLHLSRSQSRSPSTSRTHSPMWMPPGGSSDHGINRSPKMRRCSRSPHFRSEGMLERMGSRLRDNVRSPSFKRMVGYAPSDRNHTFHPHASRRIDERKGSPDRFRECEYRRSSVREQPTRAFSQHRKITPMDSPERLKLDDCYRPLLSEKFPDSVGADRRVGHDNRSPK